ncbi:hypothetical protein CW304_29585 [Bacillus sp. UFRGS-B20]|nr:hypothetical protein CW304_29585 [Bacillus sp. UFRGS-B20]
MVPAEVCNTDKLLYIREEGDGWRTKVNDDITYYLSQLQGILPWTWNDFTVLWSLSLRIIAVCRKLGLTPGCIVNAPHHCQQ